MHRLLALALLLLVLGLGPTPALAHAAGCGNGHVYDGAGQRVQESCFTIQTEVRSYRCEPFPFTDGGGIGASSARQVAERYARISCAEEYSAYVLGERANGNIAPDGLSSNFTVRPDAVRVR